MATVTVAVEGTMYARRLSPRLDVQGGADQHVPVGVMANGWVSRGGLGASSPVTQLTAGKAYKILKAELVVHGSSGAHGAIGGTRGANVKKSAKPTLNSATGDGGSGWTTAGTNYPGPSTSGSAVSVKGPASGSTARWDVTQLVCDQLPATMVRPNGTPCGGSAWVGWFLVQANREDSAADAFSLWSDDASSANRPQLVITYDPDQPPTAAPTLTTRPSGLRPVLHVDATASDPDHDPIAGLEVQARPRGGAAQAPITGIPGPTPAATVMDYTWPADLARGVWEVQVRTIHKGQPAPWSAWVPVWTDRDAVATGTAPVGGAVLYTVRPTFQVQATDPDGAGDPPKGVELEVWRANAGTWTPTGTAAVAHVTQSGAGGAIPAPADLAVGAYVWRVRANGLRPDLAAYSGAWSAWYGFEVRGTAPVISWPTGPEGTYLAIPEAVADYANPSGSAGNYHAQVQVGVAPGQNDTVGTVRVTVTDGATQLHQGRATIPPTGGTDTVAVPLRDPQHGHNGATLTVTVEATSGHGVQATASRTYRVAYLIARLARNVALGSSVANLAVRYQEPSRDTVDDVAVFLRAANGPNLNDYAPGSTWTSSAATVTAQLPAQGAHLAVQLQVVRRA
jgi:hypothetical protein